MMQQLRYMIYASNKIQLRYKHLLIKVLSILWIRSNVDNHIIYRISLRDVE